MRAKPTRKRPVPTERAEQQLVVSWARGIASRYDERAAHLSDLFPDLTFQVTRLDAVPSAPQKRAEVAA